MPKTKTQTRRHSPPPSQTTTNSPISHSDDAPEDARVRRYLRFVEGAAQTAGLLTAEGRAAWWRAEAERLDKVAQAAGGAAANYLNGVPDQMRWPGDKVPTQNIVVSPEHAASNFAFAATCATRAAVCRKIAEMGGHFQEASVVVVLGRALPPEDDADAWKTRRPDDAPDDTLGPPNWSERAPAAAAPVEPSDVPEKKIVGEDADAPHVFSATTQYDGRCSVCQKERGAPAHKAAAKAERERIKAGGPKRDGAFWRSKVGAFAARPPSEVKFDDGGVYDLQFREGGRTGKLTPARVRDWSARLRSVVSDYVWKETMLALADAVERGELPARLNGLSNDLQVRRLVEGGRSWYGSGMGDTIKTRDEFDEAVALVAPLVPPSHDIRPGFCHACKKPVAVFDGLLVRHRTTGGEEAKECSASGVAPEIHVSEDGQLGRDLRETPPPAPTLPTRTPLDKLLPLIKHAANVTTVCHVIESHGLKDLDGYTESEREQIERALRVKADEFTDAPAPPPARVLDFPAPPEVPAAVAEALAAEPSDYERLRAELNAAEFDTPAAFREWRQARLGDFDVLSDAEFVALNSEMRARAVRIVYKDTLVEPIPDHVVARLVTDTVNNVDLWMDAELTTQREIFRRVWQSEMLTEGVRAAGQKCYTAVCSEAALRDAGKRRRA